MPWITSNKPLAKGDKVLTSQGEAIVDEVVERSEQDGPLVLLKHPRGGAYLRADKAAELPRWRA